MTTSHNSPFLQLLYGHRTNCVIAFALTLPPKVTAESSDTIALSSQPGLPPGTQTFDSQKGRSFSVNSVQHLLYQLLWRHIASFSIAVPVLIKGNGKLTLKKHF